MTITLDTHQPAMPDAWELDDLCGTCGAELGLHQLGALRCPDRGGCGYAPTAFTEFEEVERA